VEHDFSHAANSCDRTKAVRQDQDEDTRIQDQDRDSNLQVTRQK